MGAWVLLLGGMPRAGVYADAIRAQGLDCVISGGSVFASTEEAKTVRALVHMLGNLADTAHGLAPVLASPLFALGVQEFLALATAWDTQTGETRRRNIELGILVDDDAPGFGELPLLARARSVLRRALSRLGKDPLTSIVRDVVNESGWMVRLAERGAEGRAQAANVLKAIDAVAEAEAELGNAPRRWRSPSTVSWRASRHPAPQRGGGQRGAHHDGARLQGPRVPRSRGVGVLRHPIQLRSHAVRPPR